MVRPIAAFGAVVGFSQHARQSEQPDHPHAESGVGTAGPSDVEDHPGTLDGLQSCRLREFLAVTERDGV